MNYELAKQLKDAGLSFEYPQTREDTCSYLDSDNNPCGVLGKNAVYVPTLSELIEACGDDFRLFTRDKKENGDFNGYSACNWNRLVIERNSTPEVAVANLWLALNKNERT